MSVLNSGFRVGFDYGAEVRPDGNLIKWKTVGKRVCLIDGDILPYTIGFIVKPEAVISAMMRVDAGEFKEVYETPEFLLYADIMNCMLNRMVGSANCDSARIYMTDSAANFRLNLAFSHPYKGTRPASKPAFFQELRRYLLETQDTILAVGEEADDRISIEAWRMAREFCEAEGIEVGSEEHKAFADYVVISKDKDLMQVPGWHLHYKNNAMELEWVTKFGYLRPKYKGDGKMKKLEGAGLKFLYAQMLMGDDVDNYKGLPGCGMVKVFDTLHPCKTEAELYFATLALYKKKYGDEYPAVNYRSSKKWRDEYFANHGEYPVDYDPNLMPIVLTGYQMMLEQGRLAFMQTRIGEVWREGKGFSPLGVGDKWNEAYHQSRDS